MISLETFAALAADYGPELRAPVTPLRLSGQDVDTDAEPVLMGVVNLSRDSTYRDSIAVSADSAVRRARIMAAQGARIIDVGAESSTAKAARVSGDDQASALVPVVERLAAEGIVVSVETYDVAVVRRCLAAGAKVLNLTGVEAVDAVYELAAGHDATVVINYIPHGNVREVGDAVTGADPIPALFDYFAERVAHARSRGVTSVVIDPGMGFYYGNLTEPLTRARHQAEVLMSSFRLRPIGVPICQAMPHAFDLFEESFRTAEGFFAVLSSLARTNVYRTHEVPHVAAVLGAMRALG